jgi:hypothetical protein
VRFENSGIDGAVNGTAAAIGGMSSGYDACRTVRSLVRTHDDRWSGNRRRGHLARPAGLGGAEDDYSLAHHLGATSAVGALVLIFTVPRSPSNWPWFFVAHVCLRSGDR